MEFDVEQFITDNAAALTPEQQTALRQSTMRTNDYQRNMNRLKADYDAKFSANDAFRDELAEWKAANQGKLTAAQLLEQRLGTPIEQLIQSPNPGYLQNPDTGQYISKADVAALKDTLRKELLGEIGPALAGTFHAAVHMPRYAYEYQQAYGGRFDGQKFVEFCQTNNITDTDLGFKLFTAEDEKKRIEESHKKEIETVRAETTRQVMSQHHIPEFSGGRPPFRSPLMRTPPAPNTTQTAPASPAPVVVPVVAPSPIPAAFAPAADLASRMQANFEKALP